MLYFGHRCPSDTSCVLLLWMCTHPCHNISIHQKLYQMFLGVDNLPKIPNIFFGPILDEESFLKVLSGTSMNVENFLNKSWRLLEWWGWHGWWLRNADGHRMVEVGVRERSSNSPCQLFFRPCNAMMVHNMEGDFRQRPASKRAPHFYSPQSSNRNSNVQGYEKSVKAAMKSIKPMVPLNGVDGKELVEQRQLSRTIRIFIFCCDLTLFSPACLSISNNQ